MKKTRLAKAAEELENVFLLWDEEEIKKFIKIIIEKWGLKGGDKKRVKKVL